MAKARPARKTAAKTAAQARTRAGAKKARRYQPHPMLGMEQRAKAKLLEETGRSYDDWAALARERGHTTMSEARAWLQAQHEALRGMTGQWIAYAAVTPGHASYEDPEPLVDALYSGAHATLRPLHEAVVDAVLDLGDDVVVTACKTMVPVYRTHVFAELRPTPGAVEVQLSLGDVRPAGRLQRSAGRMPGERLTHRVHVKGPKDVDAELRGWLADAYAKGAEKMTRSTEFEVPSDFAKALKASKRGTATWGTMTPAMRRDMVLWVTSAKQAETRARRLETAIGKLAEGKKRVY
jgi:hypothetical protein